MEKKRLLDACRKTIILIVPVLLLAACSLPRILVLHDPLNSQEHIDLGVSYEKRGEFSAAIKEYEEAAKDLPQAYLFMGNVYFQQKNYDAAAKAYRKAIDATDNPHALNNLAWLYYTTDTKLDEAERLARRAVELSPDDKGFADTLKKIRERKRANASP
jgi:tetratricopeptide (TPR) repeat protein